MNSSTPRRQIAIGSLWTLVAYLATTGTAAALTILLVRLLPRREYGAYALAISILAVVRVVSGFGLNNASARLVAVADHRDGQSGMRRAWLTGFRIAVVSAVLTLLVYALLLVAAHAMQHLKPAVRVLAILSPVAVLAGLTEFGIGFLRASGRPRILAAITSAAALVTAIGTIFILVLGHRIATLVAIPVAAGAVATAIAVIGTTWRWTRHLPPSPTAESLLRDFVRYGAATVAAGLSTVAIAYLDVVVLGAVRGRQAVALYAPASTVATVVLTLPLIIAGFYLPVITRPAVEGRHDEVEGIYRWASRWSLSLTAPALTVLIAAPDQVMRVIFGSGLGVSGTPLRILGIGVAVQVGFGFNGLTLEAYGLPGVVARRELLGVGVSLVACALLIPPLGAIGAAWATTAGLTFANLSCSQVLLTRFRLPLGDHRMGMTFGTLLATCGLALAVSTAISSDYVAVLVAVGLGFAPALVTYLGSEEGERAALRGLLQDLRRGRVVRSEVQKAESSRVG